MKKLRIIRETLGKGKTNLALDLPEKAIAADDFPGLYVERKLWLTST